MAKIHYVRDTFYLRPDVTVETLIINDSQVVYDVFEKGYHNYCHGLENLHKFINGDTSARLITLEDGKMFEGICEFFSE